ncbi:MAG: polyprenyl synthetase family protein [Thermoactinomyces sp.]
MNLQQIYFKLKNDLKWIERELEKAIKTEHQVLNESSAHLLKAGGKRMRPIFVLLSGRFGCYKREELKRVAVGLELIHMATLVHDDVIDDADTRRGKSTVKSKWDNKIAMYTGDFILARALTELSYLCDPRVHPILSAAIRQVCLGEIDQIEDLYSERQSLHRYLHRIKRKTALLMSISCQLGAMVSEAKPEYISRLKAYGYYVGMAFQLTDDVLDLVGDEKTLGKPSGNDLRQGNITLPVIYALCQADATEREMILAYLRSQGENGLLDDILHLVRQKGGIEYTLDLSKRYMEKAMQSLKELPASYERESLRLIAEFIVQRSY